MSVFHYRLKCYDEAIPILILAFISFFSSSLSSTIDVSPIPTLAHHLEGRIPNALKILKGLSRAQSTLKRLDGVAHGVYRRTTQSEEFGEGDVIGRASRAAARIGCVADGLFACELCDIGERFFLAQQSNRTSSENEKCDDEFFTTQNNNRKVMYYQKGGGRFQVLVLHEDSYTGGAGVHHGGLDGILRSFGCNDDGDDENNDSMRRGRILIIISDAVDEEMGEVLRYLDRSPSHIPLSSGLMTREVASVHGGIYRAAGKLLSAINPHLLPYLDFGTNSTDRNDTSTSKTKAPMLKSPAIHIVGRSLAGGVASLMAAILDGELPMPPLQRIRRSKVDTSAGSEVNISTVGINTSNITGCARGICSATAIGPPPCLSTNVPVPFVTSVLHGDDVVCRASRRTLNRLCSDQNKGGLGMLGGLLKTHATGSTEGEELRLSTPGSCYLVRPRSGGGASLHECSRKSLRETVLWQLDDILITESMWNHHSFQRYVHSLFGVRLRKLSITASTRDRE